MARLVTEVLRSFGVTVWLDQQCVEMDANRENILRDVGEALKSSEVVIFLVAPGDWDRFLEAEDIHRWEWEAAIASSRSCFE